MLYKNVGPKPRKTIVKQLVLQRPPRKPRFTAAYLPYLTALVLGASRPARQATIVTAAAGPGDIWHAAVARCEVW